MKNKTQTRTEQILRVMPILAWVAFIAFMIEGGAMLISYSRSLVYPEAAKDLYKGLNLFDLKEYNFWHYTLSVSFLVALSLMKAYVSYLVIKSLSKFNLSDPFTMQVAGTLEKISYFSFGTWCVTMLSNVHLSWLLEVTGKLHGTWLSGEFIFMVGLVYIISQVFKRGVEIQSENELTV